MPLSVRRRLPFLRGLVLDVDGVLTDGRLHYTPAENDLKSFHVRDGHGIVTLLREGFLVGVISGRTGEATKKRLTELGIVDIFLGVRDKNEVFRNLLAHWKIEASEVAVVGDDITDLGMMAMGGLSITVADGHRALLNTAHWVTNTSGGFGAVREVTDAILFTRKRGRPYNQEDGLC